MNQTAEVSRPKLQMIKRGDCLPPAAVHPISFDYIIHC